MFGIGGERDLSERQLDRLAGWRGSRPVRVGNGARGQRSSTSTANCWTPSTASPIASTTSTARSVAC
jgi:hypothetical protein